MNRSGQRWKPVSSQIQTNKSKNLDQNYEAAKSVDFRASPSGSLARFGGVGGQSLWVYHRQPVTRWASSGPTFEMVHLRHDLAQHCASAGTGNTTHMALVWRAAANSVDREAQEVNWIQQMAFLNLCRFHKTTLIFSTLAPDLHWSVVQMSSGTT